MYAATPEVLVNSHVICLRLQQQMFGKKTLWLVQSILHADLGSWLQQQQDIHALPLLASPTSHPTLVLHFGRASVSFGALAVVLAVRLTARL